MIGGLDKFKQTANVCRFSTTERACFISAGDPKLTPWSPVDLTFTDGGSGRLGADRHGKVALSVMNV